MSSTSKDTSTVDVDVIIVGAGLSGLRAATEIHNAGLSYVVLESMDRVGGKTLSLPTQPDGKALVDMGAAWINDTNQSEMFALAQKFGFDLVKQIDEGESLHESADGSVTQIPFGMPGNLTPEQMVEMQQVLAKLTEYIDQSDLENPHNGPDALQLDSMNALEFSCKQFGEKSVATFFISILTASLLGVDANEISALALINYIKSGAGIANITSDQKNGGQYLRNRQGNQQFSRSLAALLHPDSVKLSTPVYSINQRDTGCTVTTNTGIEYNAKKVISSVPTPLLPLINFSPALPSAKTTLANSTRLGYFSKTILVFEQPWWRNAGLSGAFTTETGPIVMTRDTCVPEDDQYSITCFHVGGRGREWSKLDAEARRAAVMEQFRKGFGSVVKEIPEPVAVLEKEWTKDPWIRGAPSPVMGPGIMTGESGKSIRQPFGHVHFVGTETAVVWKGYMEGAVRSGVRGAQEVIKALT